MDISIAAVIRISPLRILLKTSVSSKMSMNLLI
jgi:hypothetical protein